VTWVVGSLASHRVALPLAFVEEVLPMLALEQAGGPAALLGWAQLDGEPIPVVSLRALVGWPPPEDDLDHRIVIGSAGGRRVGLVLDDVLELGEAESVRPPTVEGVPLAMEVVHGVGMVGGALCLLLEPEIAIRAALEAMAGE
jgi:purine-binding chemotaxis protein CheW